MNELIEAFKHVIFRNYANFEGRARRSEYWMFNLALQLFFLTILIPLCLFAFIWMALISTLETNTTPFMIFIILFIIIYLFFILVILALLVPMLAVAVRRLHDTNRSGWWLLLGLVPFGGVAVLYFLLLNSDEGWNQYGPDPKEEERNYYRSLILNENNASSAPKDTDANIISESYE